MISNEVVVMGDVYRSASETETFSFDDGLEEAFFCRAHAEIRGRPGDLVSLVPWGSPVEGVRTEGLKWPLLKETLYPHKSRGISNELAGEAAEVEIATGLLLVVHRR